MRLQRLLAASAAAFLALGCVNGDTLTGGGDGETIIGSGKVETRTMKVADFTSVEVHSAFQVDVERGDTFRTTVTADDNLFDYITIKVEDGTLKVGTKPGKNFRLKRNDLKASITMPRLEAISLGGASSGQFGGFKPSPELAVECDGASTVSGQVDTDRLKAKVGGASTVKLKGTARNAVLSASGASQLDLNGLTLGVASVKLSGASQATVDVKEALDYSLSGASTLTYRGDPRIGESGNSGASSVVHR
jgi:hypothetical protein